MLTNKIYFLKYVHGKGRKEETGCCRAGQGRGIKIEKNLRDMIAVKLYFRIYLYGKGGRWKPESSLVGERRRN
jgi:hypothetical protein